MSIRLKRTVKLMKRSNAMGNSQAAPFALARMRCVAIFPMLEKPTSQKG